MCLVLLRETKTKRPGSFLDPGLGVGVERERVMNTEKLGSERGVFHVLPLLSIRRPWQKQLRKIFAKCPC